jgi:hypothetical protein
MITIERCFGLKAPLAFMERSKQTARSERISDPMEEEGRRSKHLRESQGGGGEKGRGGTTFAREREHVTPHDVSH